MLSPGMGEERGKGGCLKKSPLLGSPKLSSREGLMRHLREFIENRGKRPGMTTPIREKGKETRFTQGGNLGGSPGGEVGSISAFRWG